MRIGIVGLPQVGKTTIFNLLTRGNVDVSSWGGKAEAHIGIAEVPEARLEELARVVQPRKVVHATVEYVDLPGLARGEGRAALDGAARDMSAYLNNLKTADALLHVVRAFDDAAVPHPEGSVDPRRDIGLFELEMIFSDLAVVEKRLERLSKDLKKIKNPDLELENAVLGRFRKALEREQPLRELELSPEEEKRVKGFTFLSAKPVVQLVNLGEAETFKVPRVVEEFDLREYAAKRDMAVSGVAGKIEAEIAALSPEDARLFMDDLGLAEGALSRVIQQSYALLGLISFYTAGEPEVRAWTIPLGTTAQRAAGVIHTDIEKGFIKAEVVSFDDLVELGSFPAARAKGVLRLEGKDYLVQENDVILFRFNV